MTTQFYHTRDPIENLRVRVTVRKIGHGSKTEGQSTPLGTTWSACFKWQESCYAEKQRRSRKTTVDSATKEERERVNHHHGAMLCSYAHDDNYKPRGEYQRGLSTSVVAPSHLTNDYQWNPMQTRRADTTDRSAAVWTSNRKRAALRVHREEFSRQMHLVLRLDGDTTRAAGDDILLASFWCNPQSGLLRVTPPFSSCKEGEGAVDGKSPVLETYRKTSCITGEVFEYTLDNEADLFPAFNDEDLRLLKELHRQEARYDSDGRNGWQNQHGDVRLADEKPVRQQVSTSELNSREERMHAQLEIVSAHNLCTWDQVRVAIELNPTANQESSWLSETRSQQHTRWSRPMKTSAASPQAMFAHHFSISLRRRCGDSAGLAPPPPAGSSLALQLYLITRDSWKREHLIGQGELRVSFGAKLLETTVSLWQQATCVYDQVDEFLLGNATAEMSSNETRYTFGSNGRENCVHTRFGTQTVSTGSSIRIRLQFLRYHPDIIRPKSIPPVLALTAKTTSATGTKRSVKEILESLKTSRTALQTGQMPQGTSALYATPASSVRSIQEILSGVQQRDKSQ